MTGYSIEELAQAFSLDDLCGVQRELAEIIGLEATLKLCDAYASCKIYIPSNESLRTCLKARKIHEDHYGKGLKTCQLQRKYHLSDRRIQKIISMRFEDLKPPRRQMKGLF